MTKHLPLVLIFASSIVGCGANTVPQAALLCEVRAITNGYEVVCPGQPTVTLLNGRDGRDGLDGEDGYDGEDGLQSLIAQLPAQSACASGGIIVMTSLDTNRNGSVDAQDANLESSVLCNGTSAPVSQFSPVAIVDPCGTRPGIHNEVFLKLENGMLLASFSDDVGGTNTRFSILGAGNYMTTDGDRCRFTVTATNQITNESHHY